MRLLLISREAETLRCRQWTEAALAAEHLVEAYPFDRALLAALPGLQADAVVMVGLAPHEVTGLAALRARLGPAIWDVGALAAEPARGPLRFAAGLPLRALALALDQVVVRSAVDHRRLSEAGVPAYALSRVEAAADPLVFAARAKEQPVTKGAALKLLWDVADPATLDAAARVAAEVLTGLRRVHATWIVPPPLESAARARAGALPEPVPLVDPAQHHAEVRARTLTEAHLLVSAEAAGLDRLREACAVGLPTLLVGPARHELSQALERADGPGLGAAVVHWAGDAKRRVALGERMKKLDAEWGWASTLRRLGICLEAVTPRKKAAS